jgi:hypothetical protein
LQQIRRDRCETVASGYFTRISATNFRKQTMALHRDIYWLGRQWAVTGYGLQAIDQRLRGVFDIESAKLWDQGVLDALRAHDWVNPIDLDNAIAATRKRYPEPPRKAVTPVEALPRRSGLVAPERAKLAAAVLELRAQGELAKFAPQWRIKR